MAQVPIRPDLDRIIARFNARIRRLEVNGRQLPLTGAAIYTLEAGSEGASWTPDFSTATKAIDTIGCVPTGSGLIVPAGWTFDACFAFAVKAAVPPPTGECLQYSVYSIVSEGVEYGDQRNEAMFNSTSIAQDFTGMCFGSTGGLADAGVGVSVVASAFGTEFTAQAGGGIAVIGINLFDVGFTGGID